MVRRNLLVWRKLAAPSVVVNVAEPLITLVAFGYGLGTLVGQVRGLPYIIFLASGSIVVSGALAATFEALYSAFSRMHAAEDLGQDPQRAGRARRHRASPRCCGRR